jgi:hypothetical protein
MVIVDFIPQRKKKMKLDKNDFKALIICSFRYALGRHSYMPSWIAEIIRKHVNDIDIHTKNLIIDEIKNYKSRYDTPSLMYDCDIATWESLKLFLEEYK